MAPANLKQRIVQTIAWIVVFPFLVAWPFLSAFPAFSLFQGNLTAFAISLNIVFLLTGFWAIAGAFAAIWFLMRGEARSQMRKNRSDRGLMLGAYASVWSVLFIIAAFANR